MSPSGFSSVLAPFETEPLPLRQLYPITFRGTVFLSLVAYLALGPARQEADIVASVVAYSLLVAALPLLFISVTRGIRLKNQLILGVSAEPTKDASIERIESSKQVRIALQVPAISIPPFFTLTIRAKFPDHQVILADQIVTGSLDRPRYLVHDLIFPHRGVWEFDQVRIEFGDQLGLFRFGWNLERSDIRCSFTIYPTPGDASSLPVISSCERSGDLLSHSRERLGDPFDIRQYHPTDGARRILWKVFARRGELVSRHPEASMTPEGQVVIFAPLSKYDDESAGLAIDYIKKLEELQLQIYFGCLGMNGASPARSASSAEEMLVDTAWSIPETPAKAESELRDFIDRTISSIGTDSSISRVVLFTSPKRFRSAEDRLMMVQVGRALIGRGITPVIITTRGMTGLDPERVHELSPMRERAVDLIFQKPNNFEVYNPSEYRSFMGVCAAEGWEVIINGEG